MRTLPDYTRPVYRVSAIGNSAGSIWVTVIETNDYKEAQKVQQQCNDEGFDTSLWPLDNATLAARLEAYNQVKDYLESKKEG